MDCKLGCFSSFYGSNFLQSSDHFNLNPGLKSSSRPLKRPSELTKKNVSNELLNDLLYAEDFTSDEIVDCLLKRYLIGKYFTWFGNVLFYIQPPLRDPLKEYSEFLYSGDSGECHLYTFLKEIFRSLIKSQTKKKPFVEENTDVDDLVRQISDRFSTFGNVQNVENYNVFFYGDNNFGQLYSSQKSLIFLTQYVHSLGLEPSSTLNAKVLNSLKLLVNLSDYTSCERSHNYMITYKMNFNVFNQLVSVTLVPNFSTDFSCSVVSNSFRELLRENLLPPFEGLDIRFPTIFYGILHSISKGKNVKWFSSCSMSSECASGLLELIPTHEIGDQFYHIGNFTKMIELFLEIGFKSDEIKYLINIFLSILLFDVYTILKNSSPDSSPSSSLDDDKDLSNLNRYSSQNKGANFEKNLSLSKLSSDVEDKLDLNETKLQNLNLTSEDGTATSSEAGTGTSSDEEKSKRIIFYGVDLLDLILDLLGIDLLKIPNSELKYSDILFKFELSSKTHSDIFDNLSSSLYLRLKHLIYYKINAYLVIDDNNRIKRNSQFGVRYGTQNNADHVPKEVVNVDNSISKSLSLHCNVGFNSNFIKLSDYNLPWNFSEELIINKMVTGLNCDVDGELEVECNGLSDYTRKYINKNKELIEYCTMPHGLLSNIILETVSYRNDETISKFEPKVCHSWDDVMYNIPNIIKIDSTIYSIPLMIRTLFKYSKNEILIGLLFSNNSLYPIVGNCASSLSYYNYLKNNSNKLNNSYMIILSSSITLNTSKDLNITQPHLSDYNESLKILIESLNKRIPILDLCINKRNREWISLSLTNWSNSYLVLIFLLTKIELHKSVTKIDNKMRVKLLFGLLSVSNEYYKIEGDLLIMKKSLHVKMTLLLNDYERTYLDNIKLIQRLWKNLRYKYLKKRLIDLIIRLQSLSRMNNCKKLLEMPKRGTELADNFIGLVIMCFYLNASLKKTTSKTLQLFYSMEKEFHQKEYKYLQHSAATYIQSIWRGSIERKKYGMVKRRKFEDFSIILIQSTIRRVLACSQILNVRNTKILNVVKIQSYFRGYVARKRYQKLMQLKLLLLPILKKGSKINGMCDQINFIKLYKDYDSLSLQMKKLISVQTNLPPGFVKVQNLIRMRFVRKQYLHLKSSLEKIHALAMTKVARLNYLEKVNAVIKIQRWWRCLPKDSFPQLSNVIYYVNLREKSSLNLLSKELEGFGVNLFHFNTHQDIRKIYPNTWAMPPLGFVKNIKLMQKSSSDLNYTQIRKIECVKFSIGSTHSLMLIVTDNGSCVYSWGWNDKGQLGRNNLYPLKNYETDFMLMEPLEFVDDYKDRLYDQINDKISIVEVSCGNDFSLALTSMGRVFSWGDNSMGQCGHGHRLLKVHYPKPLELTGVDYICCGSLHSLVGICGEYMVFGNAFERNIFKPINVKSFAKHLNNQNITKVNCSGSITLILTQELDYVLNVFSHVYNFQKIYNLKGIIKSFCTNGKMICVIVEIPKGEYENSETKVYLFGHVRCIVQHDKNTVTNKSLFVGAFREKFENIGKRRVKQSSLNVYNTSGSVCFLEYPTEVILPKTPIQVQCDYQQVLFTTFAGVYGSRVFQLLSENPGDFEIIDNSKIKINQPLGIRLEPSLYQFTNITKKRPTIHLSFNSLSHSMGYTF